MANHVRLLTAAFTPFDPDGRLDLDKVSAQAEWYLAHGCPGVFVAGTAGEGASLTVAERMALVERWCEVAADRLDIIVHVGHTSLAEAQALATHAQATGAQAIASVAPYFHRPGDVAALVDFLGQLAQAAPALPFTYYHIPDVTGVHLRASDVLLAASGRIPTFAGIKFAANDFADLQRCLALAEGNQEIYVGAAKLLLAAVGAGARTAIGSVYNFAAPLYQTMLKQAAAGDLHAAYRSQALAQTTIDTIAGYSGELPGFKATTRLVGLDCGPCRRPLVSPNPTRLDKLRDDLEGIGFLDALARAPR